MTFRELVTHETSALLSRVAAAPAQSAQQQLEVFHAALREATQAVEGAVNAWNGLAHPDEIAATVDRLAGAAEAEIRSLRQELEEVRESSRRALEEAAHNLGQMTASAEEHARCRAVAEAELESTRTHLAASRQQVETVAAEGARERATLDAAVQEARTALAAAREEEALLRGVLESELNDARAAADAARGQAAQIASQHEAEAAQRAKTAETLAALETKLLATEQARQALVLELAAIASRAESLDAATIEADRTRLALQSRLESAAMTEAQLRQRTMELEAQTSDAKRQQEAEIAARQDVERQLSQARADAARDAAARIGDQDQHAAHAKALADADREGPHETAAAMEAAAQAVRARDEALARVEQARTEQAGSTCDQITMFASLRLERLQTVFDSLTSCRSVAELMTALAAGMASEFSRVALFMVKDTHLEGMHQVGFELKSDVSKVAIPLSGDSLLTKAVTSGRIETLHVNAAGEQTRTVFGGAPHFVLAMPVTLNGNAVAVIYADDSDQKNAEFIAPDLKLKFAELLQLHAVPMLGRLSTELKALSELRDYATLLIDEIEYMYGADIESGKKGRDLLTRLTDNLQCARQIYHQRIKVEGPAAAGLLEERLVAVVAAKKNATFARDLGKVVAATPASLIAGSQSDARAS